MRYKLKHHSCCFVLQRKQSGCAFNSHSVLVRCRSNTRLLSLLSLWSRHPNRSAIFSFCTSVNFVLNRSSTPRCLESPCPGASAAARGATRSGQGRRYWSPCGGNSWRRTWGPPGCSAVFTGWHPHLQRRRLHHRQTSSSSSSTAAGSSCRHLRGPQVRRQKFPSQRNQYSRPCPLGIPPRAAAEASGHGHGHGDGDSKQRGVEETIQDQVYIGPKGENVVL